MPHGKSGIPQRKAMAMGKGYQGSKPSKPAGKSKKGGKKAASSSGGGKPMGASHKY